MQMVELQDLSLMFGMTCSEVVAEIHHLEEEGQLTGVLDDRGKVRCCQAAYFVFQMNARLDLDAATCCICLPLQDISHDTSRGEQRYLITANLAST